MRMRMSAHRNRLVGTVYHVGRLNGRYRGTSYRCGYMVHEGEYAFMHSRGVTGSLCWLLM